MAKNITNDEAYWKKQYESVLRDEYEKFLKSRNLEMSTENAYLFSESNDIQNLLASFDVKKDHLIIMLAGELPDMYY